MTNEAFSNRSKTHIMSAAYCDSFGFFKPLVFSILPCSCISYIQPCVSIQRCIVYTKLCAAKESLLYSSMHSQ